MRACSMACSWAMPCLFHRLAGGDFGSIRFLLCPDAFLGDGLFLGNAGFLDSSRGW